MDTLPLMFAALGRVVTRFPWLVVAAWVILAVLVISFAPKLTSTSDESEFLPAHYESIKAATIQQKEFPSSSQVGAILVFDHKDGDAYWYKISVGLPQVPVLDIKLSQDGKALFAATFGRSVWKLPLSTDATDGGGAGGSVPATLSLSLGTPGSLGPFQPGVAKDYTASTTATETHQVSSPRMKERVPSIGSTTKKRFGGSASAATSVSGSVSSDSQP